MDLRSAFDAAVSYELPPLPASTPHPGASPPYSISDDDLFNPFDDSELDADLADHIFAPFDAAVDFRDGARIVQPASPERPFPNWGDPSPSERVPSPSAFLFAHSRTSRATQERRRFLERQQADLQSLRLQESRRRALHSLRSRAPEEASQQASTVGQPVPRHQARRHRYEHEFDQQDFNELLPGASEAELEGELGDEEFEGSPQLSVSDFADFSPVGHSADSVFEEFMQGQIDEEFARIEAEEQQESVSDIQRSAIIRRRLNPGQPTSDELREERRRERHRQELRRQLQDRAEPLAGTHARPQTNRNHTPPSNSFHEEPWHSVTPQNHRSVVDLTDSPPTHHSTDNTMATTRGKRGQPSSGSTEQGQSAVRGSNSKRQKTEHEPNIEELDLVDVDGDQDYEAYSQKSKEAAAELVRQQRQEEADRPIKLADFQCIICLDTPTDLTVTFCGHLFCSICLHEALNAGTRQKSCPVCRQAISLTKKSVKQGEVARMPKNGVFPLSMKLMTAKKMGKQAERR